MLARLALVCLVLGCSKARPEDATIQKSAKAGAEEIQSALVKGDYATVADLTHPRIVEGMGGREKMLEVMTRGLDEMKAGGVEIISVKVLDPAAPVKGGSETYIFVPFDLEMKAPGKRISSRGGLVGVTGDGGKTWKFIDTSPGRAALKKALPDLPDSLEFPKKEPPKVVDG